MATSGESGIPLGGAALTEEQTRALVKKGYRLLWHAFDVLVLKQFVRQTGDQPDSLPS